MRAWFIGCASMAIFGCGAESVDESIQYELGTNLQILEGPEGQDWSGATNGVRGGGPNQGSFDVTSLGYDEGVNHALVFEILNGVLVDEPGIDFVVFENAFQVANSESVFMDQVIIELSSDNESWVTFPHDYVSPDEESYSANPAHWIGFAGVIPVKYHGEENPVDPFDQALAGGDHFDLSELDQYDPAVQELFESGIQYLRLVTAPTRINPDTGSAFPRSPVSDGADIDGIFIRHLSAE